jgi:hypothetical protein
VLRPAVNRAPDTFLPPFSRRIQVILSAQIRKEITQLRTFTVALNTFKGKYNALPGDMANATTYWGTDPNCNGGSYVSSPPEGTCNGNGDGFISADVYISADTRLKRFLRGSNFHWQNWFQPITTRFHRCGTPGILTSLSLTSVFRCPRRHSPQVWVMTS